MNNRRRKKTTKPKRIENPYKTKEVSKEIAAREEPKLKNDRTKT